MRTIPDTAPPISLEEAEEASARLAQQVGRARRVLDDYREAAGVPPAIIDADPG